MGKRVRDGGEGNEGDAAMSVRGGACMGSVGFKRGFNDCCFNGYWGLMREFNDCCKLPGFCKVL